MLGIALNTISPDRIITIYVIYASLAVLFTIFGIKLIKRGDTNQRKKLIIQFFFYLAGGLYLNMIYAPFDYLILQTIGNKTVIFLSTIGIGNLLLFVVSISKSELEFTPNKVVLSELIIASIAAGYYVIPIEFGPNYTPIWPITFIIYCAIVTQILFVIAILSGFRILKTMQDRTIRKKFSAFLLGLLCIELVLVQTLLKNGQFVQSPLLLVMGLSIIPGGLLIYYGVGKELNEQK
jgi:hypothetical protein